MFLLVIVLLLPDNGYDERVFTMKDQPTCERAMQAARAEIDKRLPIDSPGYWMACSAVKGREI